MAESSRTPDIKIRDINQMDCYLNKLMHADKHMLRMLFVETARVLARPEAHVVLSSTNDTQASSCNLLYV